jgi:hypothetical protein
VLLKANPSGTGLLIWGFHEQLWLTWNPRNLEKARALLWHGVLVILKALYFSTRTCSARDIARWAPDEYTYLVYTREEWATKLKINQSLFQSAVLQKSLTYSILKQWRTLNTYPKRQADCKTEMEVEAARRSRRGWFLRQAKSDKEAFLTFTRFTSEAIDWELVYERKTPSDNRVYNWIISSLASAANTAFDFEIDDQMEETTNKTRRGKRERNEKWPDLTNEHIPAYDLFPLTDIFWLEPLVGDVEEIVSIDKSLGDVSSVATLQESQNDPEAGASTNVGLLERTQKRRRQQTQKAREAREALEEACKKRPRKSPNPATIAVSSDSRLDSSAAAVGSL